MENKLKLSIILLVAYCAVIFVFSSLPNTHTTPEAGLGFTVDSSLKHFAEYTILGVLSFNAFYLFKKIPESAGITTLFFGFGFGVSDEVHQYFVPTRFCTMTDVVVNVLGVSFGVLLFVIVLTIIRWRNQ